jgi:peptide/nickel transport system permease protein
VSDNRARGVRRHSRLPRTLRAPVTVAAIAIVAAWLLAGALAPWIAPREPMEQNLAARLAPPSRAHWLGTDQLGRDVFSRVLHGARLSIPVGLLTVAIAIVLGVTIGALSGYFGGYLDETVMRLIDLLLAFPSVILVMVITAALGAGARNAVVAITIAWWPVYARFSRGLALSLRDLEYVQAARAVGASTGRVLRLHVLPGMIAPVSILGTLDVGRAILTFASMSFLGLGPPPGTPEWGAMVAAGRNNMEEWWISATPGAAILTCVLSINILGDALRDVLDPRLRAN